MTDNTPRGRRDIPSQAPASLPVRLARGQASPEELSAVVAVVAVLAAGGGGDPGQTDRAPTGAVASSRSPWSAPARLVRTTHPHGPGGWRASASPR